MCCRSFFKLYLILIFVSIISFTTEAGALSFIEMHQDNSGSIDGLDGAGSIAVSPDSNHVYVAGSRDDAIAVFSRDTTTGRLTFVEVQEHGVGGVDGLRFPVYITVSPDNNHVYVGSDSISVAVFSRDILTGRLTFVERISSVRGPFSVAVSPDNNHVYVTSFDDNSITVFSRNTTTGRLTFVEEQEDGVGGVDGLEGAAFVTVSPDNNHVYATGILEDSIAVFSRNTTNGTLSFIEVLRDGVGGVDGLGGADDISVSPDNNHVYVAGMSNNAIAVFSRNTTTGRLAFVEVQKDGVGGVDGLLSVSSVFVSPDNNQVFATSNDENSIAVFNRNLTNGTLIFVEVQKDGVGGVDGLEGAYSVAVSPDSNFVYTAASRDDSVVVFANIYFDTIPSLSEWGMIILSLLLVTISVYYIRRKNMAV